MYGYFYDNFYVYLVYDYVKRGNLFSYIKSASRLSEKEAAKVFFFKTFFALVYK